MALNPKQRRFVAEYLKDQNGTQAAIRAGYSPKTAQEQSSQLLSKLMVKNAIGDKLRKIEEESVLTAENVRAAVARLMQVDPRKAFNSDGTMKKIHEMPDDVVRAITGIDSNDRHGELSHVRFTDPVRVLELGAKILGLLKFQLTGKGGVPLVPPEQRIDFSRIDDDTLKRIAFMGNGQNG